MFQYDDDLVYLMPPNDISPELIRPRFSMVESYIGKTELEVGMDIRLKWSTSYNRCKASIMGVSSDSEEMNALFDQLDQQRIDKVMKDWKVSKAVSAVGRYVFFELSRFTLLLSRSSTTGSEKARPSRQEREKAISLGRRQLLRGETCDYDKQLTPAVAEHPSYSR